MSICQYKLLSVLHNFPINNHYMLTNVRFKLNPQNDLLTETTFLIKPIPTLILLLKTGTTRQLVEFTHPGCRYLITYCTIIWRLKTVSFFSSHHDNSNCALFISGFRYHSLLQKRNKIVIQCWISVKTLIPNSLLFPHE